jgi:hypothetical protein
MWPDTDLICATVRTEVRKPNSVDAQKTLLGKTEFAKRKWFYAYAEIPAVLDEQRCERAIRKLFSRYSKVTKAWDDIKNTEWTCRLYMAAKLIMMATLQLNSLDFAESVNLRAANPHFRYYALLSLSRAISHASGEQVERWRFAHHDS